MTGASERARRPSPLLSLYRLLLAGWILVILAEHYFSGPSSDLFESVNFFSYFTNETTLIAAVALIAAAAGRSDDVPLAWLRGAALVYILTMAIANQLILHAGLSNIVLHVLAPVGVLADWLVAPPAVAVSARTSLAWVAYPLPGSSTR